MYVHGDNLTQKEAHQTKYTDPDSRMFLQEIRERYDEWREANLKLKGPGVVISDDDEVVIEQRVQLLNGYKDFLDQQLYAEKFDSRSNLHSSVLEEFFYYLFKDIVSEFGQRVLIGKSHTFKDLFFSPPNFTEMVSRPYARIEKKDHDFVIGVRVETDMVVKPYNTLETFDSGGSVERIEPPQKETHLFDVPAIVIECKTYLDKTMLEGSSSAAEQLKARNPNALYIVVMEWLKLTESVNLRKYKVDQIYVLRKQKNTDREFRFAETYVKNPIYSDVVFHLFSSVRQYLTSDWRGGVEYGLERGHLI